VASRTAETSPREIAVDRLPEAGPSLAVLLLDNATFHSDDECGPTRPHRHDYHELIWTREGTAKHLIDGEVSLADPNEITLIGRSQVHVFERARGLSGAVLRFGEELLHGDAIANPSWLAGSRLLHRVAVSAADVPRLQSLINTLAEETQRPTDSRSVELRKLAEHWEVWEKEATRAESASGLPMFGDHFPDER
jgi:AraC family transcriptional regulator, transcriptional activator of pobA